MRIFPGRRYTICDSDERAIGAYDYALPTESIAQVPAAQRDASRLMVLDGDGVEHRSFDALPTLLHRDDLLVLNETRVIPARLLGRRLPGDATVELLLLHPARGMRYDPDALAWIALARPARRLHAGDRIGFGSLGEGVVARELEGGMREVAFEIAGRFETFLERAGRMPIPPYIRNETREAQDRYQTIFARVPGSVAAPTASLHFTREVLEAIAAGGTEIVRLTLDVGLGTFRPVSAERIDDHRMHEETYAIGPEAADRIELARRSGRRIVAAGTTVVRALEGNVQRFGRVTAGEHTTEIFITPGFEFRVIGALITNFHLPRSTLLMLVSAFAGRRRILRAYSEAVRHGYRFFSFGDAMFVSSREGNARRCL